MSRRPHAHVTPEQADRARRLSEVHGHFTVVELTGISSSTLSELKKRGFRSACRPLRSIPADWSITAPGRTQAELQRHYMAGPSTIQRWLRLSPVERPAGGTPAFAIPPDLADTLSLLRCEAAAARHYGVSPGLIRRWRGECALDLHGRTTMRWEERYRAALEPTREKRPSA